MRNNPYRAAGTFDGESYVERQADADLLDAILRKQRYLYFLAPRQSGKSSLIIHTISKLDTTKFDVAIVDLSIIPQQCFESYDKFLAAFVSELFSELGTPNQCGIFKSDLRRVLESIASSQTKRVLIFVDEIDRLKGVKFKDDFFALIRWSFNQRSRLNNFKRIQFILSGVAQPSELISKESVSPFNVGHAIKLEDMSLEEVREATRHLNACEWDVKEDVAPAIYEQTGGMVYLTELILERLWEFVTVSKHSEVNRELVERIVVEIVEQSSSNIHFLNIWSSIVKNSDLHTAFLDVAIRGSKNSFTSTLEMIGIIREGRYRSQIYERVFGQNGPLSLFDVKYSYPWNVPFECNPCFTGRDKIISQLVNALSKNSAGALTQAISGLGGIGKTQVAVEYAYRCRDKYNAVFWVRADTTLELHSGFIEIAKMLALPEKDTCDSIEVVRAVKRWLQNNSGWLLIFDNADNPELIKDFRPLNPKGHILLTSRAQVFQTLGISNPIEIDEMSPGEALEFLYKRTGREDTDVTEKEAAVKLAHDLGYLPLALEQAAAYVTHKQARFQDYYAEYLKRKLELLKESRPVAGAYPESVTTTWAMNFTEVEKESKAAADLLRLSAFLAPDSIPLDLIKAGASRMGDPLYAAIGNAEDDILAINKALEPLTRYSLIRRDINAHTYSIHRMVQEVLKHGMDTARQKLWAERAVRAVDQAFPEVEFANWALCDRLLPHGTEAILLIEQYSFEFQEAGHILNQVGYYLDERGRYAEAEPLYNRSLAISEKAMGPEHPDVAASFNNLAGLYDSQGKYAEAEPLYQRSLAIWEKALGPEHPAVATSLNNLAGLYRVQGRYAKAEPLYQRSLTIWEKALGTEHPNVATSLNNLARLYRDQGKHAEAEPLYKRSLAIREEALGPEHPDVAASLENYAGLLRKMNRVTEATKMEARAKELRAKHTKKT